MRAMILSFIASSALLATGCSAIDGGASCNGGKCDGTGDFGSKLDGRNDPIANFLREAGVDDSGVVGVDYGGIAQGVAGLEGCSEQSWLTFVISDPLVEGEAFPRLISTVCSDDATKASQFFIAASFKDPDEADVDPHNLEMFAWDATAGVYRFYAAEPHGKDAVQIDVEPERCQGCHLTPKNLARDGMRMTPIMNELTQPWSHWNSQVPMFNDQQNPFPSHEFDVPNDVRSGNDFGRYGMDRIGAAADLEQIIRAGHSRVEGERVKERRGTAADYKPAMNLLRPLFCEEQVQYATEDFNTGLVLVTALIPGGIREAYRTIRPDNWAWGWINNQDARIRLPAPNTIPALEMIPVRGNADSDYENRLLGVRALTPNQILRVRALDWKRPVFSDFRCGLWTKASEEFAKNPPDLNLSGRILEHMRVLYDLIMNVDGVSLKTATEDTFVALDLATPESIAAMTAGLRDGNLPTNCSSSASCNVNVDIFGGMLDDYIQGFMNGDSDTVRRQLQTMRDERLCHVKANFPNAPHLPEVSCP